MPAEFAVLFALITLNAIRHLLAFPPLPESFPNLLPAMPLPRTLVMVLGCPLWPIVKNPSLWCPTVTAMPLVPIPDNPGPLPVIVLSWISSGLARLPIVPPTGPAPVLPTSTWMPPPTGKFRIVLLLIDPVVIDARLAPSLFLLAYTLIPLPNEFVALVLLVKLFPVIVRFEIVPA